MDLEKSLRNLESIGRSHIELSIEDYEKNAYDSFKGFIRSCFYRGRSDETSQIYIKYALEAVDSLCKNINGDSEKVKYLSHKGDRLVEEYSKLVKNHNKKHHKKELNYQETKTHPTDEKLLRSICDNFAEDLKVHDYNIRKFCAKYFEKNNLKGLYERLDRIEGVGQKLASLYIRDMLAYYEKSYPQSELKLSQLKEDDFKYVYPVDTWVKQITKKMFNRNELTGEEAMKLIITKCKSGISPVYVNHGIWYIGSKSNQFLIDNLENLDKLVVKTR